METFSVVDSQLQASIVKRVICLSWQGFGYKKIIKKIKEEFFVNLSSGLLSYWFNNEVRLYGGQNHFDSKPTKELAYVLGVMFGDGNLFFHEKKQDYAVRLEAIDKDFVEYFSKCVSKVLNKERNYAVVKYKQKAMDSCMYSARARSKELYYFIKELKEDFEKVKPFAEAYPKEFIQGLADSEGFSTISARTNFSVGVCVAVSTNKDLLCFVKKLLIGLGIVSSMGISKRKGMSDSIINGRIITRTMDLFYLKTVSFFDTEAYSNKINFSIARKSEKLRDGILVETYVPCFDKVSFWKNLYEKRSNQWFRQ